MKAQSLTFFCDVKGCDEVLTVIEDNDTEGYMSLIEKGWKVRRNPVSGWKHVCTTHTVGDLNV